MNQQNWEKHFERKVLCKCNVEPLSLTVKKAGINKGRHFLKCGKGGTRDGGCEFFRFIDHQPVVQCTSSAVVTSALSCNCNLPAAQRLIKTEGMKITRLFGSCAKGKCDYLKFADPPSLKEEEPLQKKIKKEEDSAVDIPETTSSGDIMNQNNQITTGDRYDIFAAFVSSRLRLIPDEGTLEVAEKKIINILFN